MDDYRFKELISIQISSAHIKVRLIRFYDIDQQFMHILATPLSAPYGNFQQFLNKRNWKA